MHLKATYYEIIFKKAQVNELIQDKVFNFKQQIMTCIFISCKSSHYQAPETMLYSKQDSGQMFWL